MIFYRIQPLMTIKRLFTFAFAGFCCTALFSLTMLSFHGDISLLAFPFALVFLAALCFVSKTLFFAEMPFAALCSAKALAAAGEQQSVRMLPAYRTLLQYEPYLLLIAFVFRRAGNHGTPFVLDLLSVLLWLASSCFVLLQLHYINPKRAGALDERWGAALVAKKRRGAQLLIFEAVSWIDALVQAVFMVLLLNIFIVQLYEIPSESMVPEFLIKDRVVVFKTASGPKFPLSDIGLPYLKNYKRGDIVVFRNPHYANDRKSEVRTFVSQIVYMISLTTVNLNVDADGDPKADPLVKRVTGVPGEQLMMQDGVLYARTRENAAFTPVAEDRTWAAWNLNEVPKRAKNGIRQFPLSDSDYADMLSVEKERNALDLAQAARECELLASRFAALSRSFASLERTGSVDLTQKDLPVFVVVQSSAGRYYDYWLLTDRVSSSMTNRLLQAKDGDAWFSAYMTDWAKQIPDFAGDLYAEANYKLNVLIKLAFGHIVVRNLELFASGTMPSLWNSDSERLLYFAQAQQLSNYVLLLDRRNMPMFPANDAEGKPQYIPEGCYFMMGDNRFNSLDMRHSYEEWLTPLTEHDAYSVTYYTNMQPQFVDRSRILGTTSFRFWPTSRMGVPGHTGFAE